MIVFLTPEVAIVVALAVGVQVLAALIVIPRALRTWTAPPREESK